MPATGATRAPSLADHAHGALLHHPALLIANWHYPATDPVARMARSYAAIASLIARSMPSMSGITAGSSLKST